MFVNCFGMLGPFLMGWLAVRALPATPASVDPGIRHPRSQTDDTQEQGAVVRTGSGGSRLGPLLVALGVALAVFAYARSAHYVGVLGLL